MDEAGCIGISRDGLVQPARQVVVFQNDVRQVDPLFQLQLFAFLESLGDCLPSANEGRDALDGNAHDRL